MTQVDIEQLRDIAEIEFSDIVREAISPDLNELRIILRDGSFIDIWFSLKLPGRYSYHWGDGQLTERFTGMITLRINAGRLSVLSLPTFTMGLK